MVDGGVGGGVHALGSIDWLTTIAETVGSLTVIQYRPVNETCRLCELKHYSYISYLQFNSSIVIKIKNSKLSQLI